MNISVALKDFSSAECDGAFRDIARKLESENERGISTDRFLNFKFTVGGVDYAEREFFDEFARRKIPTASLRALIARFSICHGLHMLVTDANDMAMGPALRTYISLNPDDFEFLEHAVMNQFHGITDHGYYRAGLVLEAYVKLHGWRSRDVLRIGIELLNYCDYTTPKDMPGLHLMDGAAKLMSSQEFASFYLAQPSVADVARPGVIDDDFVIEDFLGRYDAGDNYVAAVVAAIETKIGRPALRPRR